MLHESYARLALRRTVVPSSSSTSALISCRAHDVHTNDMGQGKLTCNHQGSRVRPAPGVIISTVQPCLQGQAHLVFFPCLLLDIACLIVPFAGFVVVIATLCRNPILLFLITVLFPVLARRLVACNCCCCCCFVALLLLQPLQNKQQSMQQACLSPG